MTYISLFAVMLLVIIASFFVRLPEDKVVFLDVGQGDAILIQKGSKQILIDGGQGMKVLERLGEEMPLFDRRLDVVIASHPDRDHLEGLLHVIERYDVELVLLPSIAHTSQLQEEWLKRLRDQMNADDIDYRFAQEGQELTLSQGVELQLLGPFFENGEIVAPGGKTNNASVLARLDFYDLSFLLTADAESTIERRLVREVSAEILDVDVLKAGHHGSNTSTTADLLRATTPAAVVVSVGKDNRYGHPHPKVLERLQGLRVVRTDEKGSIGFVYSGKEWLLRS